MRSWDDLRFVLAVERGHSFAAGARALDVEISTVTRRIAAIEKEAGGAIFLRRSKGVVATEMGAAIISAAEHVDLRMRTLERTLTSGGGPVRVATTEALAERILLDGAPIWHSRLGAIEIELLTSNAIVDIAQRQADIAVRLVKPTEPDLVARKVATFGYGLYASQKYLARHGVPTRDALRGHAVILGTRDLADVPEWRWLAERAKEAYVALRTNGPVAARIAIEAGLGIGVLPRGMAEVRPDLVLIDKLADTRGW